MTPEEIRQMDSWVRPIPEELKGIAAQIELAAQVAELNGLLREWIAYNHQEITIDPAVLRIDPRPGNPRKLITKMIDEATAEAQDRIRDYVFPYYINHIRPGSLKIYTCSRTRLSQGVNRLLECRKKTNGDWEAAVSLMEIAIDTMRDSDFHMGRDPKSEGRKYNEWENLFRSSDMLEKWLSRAQETP